MQYINPDRILPTSYQVFEGISREEASSESFKAALLNSVSEVLGVPADAVTLSVEVGRRNKRSLLSSVSLTYTASVTSGMSSDTVLAKMNDALNQGTYLDSMIEKSGLSISNMSGIDLMDVTPTAPPQTEQIALSTPMTGMYPTNG